MARVNVLKQVKSDTGWKLVAIPRNKKQRPTIGSRSPGGRYRIDFTSAENASARRLVERRRKPWKRCGARSTRSKEEYSRRRGR